MRPVCADPTDEPKHYKDDQNDPEHASESGSPIATVSIVSTTPAENQNQQNDDQNRAHLSPSLRESLIKVTRGDSTTSSRRPALCPSGRQWHFALSLRPCQLCPLTRAWHRQLPCRPPPLQHP